MENGLIISPNQRRDLVIELVRTKLGLDPTILEDRSTGFSGNVYVVGAKDQGGERKLVVKLTPFEEEPELEAETALQRVYTNRYSNFCPAHKLLHSNNFPIASIIHYGDQPDASSHYQIVSFLDGISVREALEDRNTPASEQLHEVTGEMFGLLHQKVTRHYDGWVGQDKPYQTSWRMAVEEAINQQFERCIALNARIRKLPIPMFINRTLNQWTDPAEFVLSDMDGFQGMAMFNNGKWEITGLIDIEDHKFCDQRMVLAGYELSLLFNGLPVPPDFWRGYTRHKQVDPQYENIKRLFQLNYLLSWMQIPYEGHEHVMPEEKEPTITKFERLIETLVTG